MVKVLKRSISFPSKIHSHSVPMPHHTRSISLPCRSHPLISQLRDEINGLNSWYAEPQTRSPAWLCDGLRRLKQAHDSLDDILQLPQTQDSLRQQPKWAEKLLEDFLLLVDVYGIFQTSILAFREDHSAVHVAIRKRDESKVVSYVKSRKSFNKDMAKLASMVRCVGRDESAGMASVIDDVIGVTKMVSLAIFTGMSFSSTRKYRWTGMRLVEVKVDDAIQEFGRVESERLWELRKMGEEEVRRVLKRMRDLESGIVGVESGSQRVFRGLINARVSLLNSLTKYDY